MSKIMGERRAEMPPRPSTDTNERVANRAQPPAGAELMRSRAQPFGCRYAELVRRVQATIPEPSLAEIAAHLHALALLLPEEAWLTPACSDPQMPTWRGPGATFFGTPLVGAPLSAFGDRMPAACPRHVWQLTLHLSEASKSSLSLASVAGSLEWIEACICSDYLSWEWAYGARRRFLARLAQAAGPREIRRALLQLLMQGLDVDKLASLEAAVRQPWAAASLATPYGRLSWSERWYRAGMWLIWVAETTSWLCVATQQPQWWQAWKSAIESSTATHDLAGLKRCVRDLAHECRHVMDDSWAAVEPRWTQALSECQGPIRLGHLVKKLFAHKIPASSSSSSSPSESDDSDSDDESGSGSESDRDQAGSEGTPSVSVEPSEAARWEELDSTAPVEHHGALRGAAGSLGGSNAQSGSSSPREAKRRGAGAQARGSKQRRGPPGRGAGSGASGSGAGAGAGAGEGFRAGAEGTEGDSGTTDEREWARGRGGSPRRWVDGAFAVAPGPKRRGSGSGTQGGGVKRGRGGGEGRGAGEGRKRVRGVRRGGGGAGQEGARKGRQEWDAGWWLDGLVPERPDSDDEVDDPSEPWAREDPADLIATPKHESMHPSLPQHPSQRPSSLTASPANGRADSRLDDQCQPQSDCLPTAFYLWQPGVEASVSVTHPKAGFESYVVMGEAVGKAVAKAANEALLGLRRSRLSYAPHGLLYTPEPSDPFTASLVAQLLEKEIQAPRRVTADAAARGGRGGARRGWPNAEDLARHRRGCERDGDDGRWEGACEGASGSDGGEGCEGCEGCEWCGGDNWAKGGSWRGEPGVEQGVSSICVVVDCVAEDGPEATSRDMGHTATATATANTATTNTAKATATANAATAIVTANTATPTNPATLATPPPIQGYLRTVARPRLLIDDRVPPSRRLPRLSDPLGDFECFCTPNSVIGQRLFNAYRRARGVADAPTASAPCLWAAVAMLGGFIPWRLRVERVPGKGLGCVARELIPEGSIVVEYVGELVTESGAHLRQHGWGKRGNGNRRLDHSNHFTLQIRKMGTKIPKCFVLHDVKCRAVTDPTVRGNVARLINHSCDGGNLEVCELGPCQRALASLTQLKPPTWLWRSGCHGWAPPDPSGAMGDRRLLWEDAPRPSWLGQWLPRLVLMAKRDIYPGEELTYDYNMFGDRENRGAYFKRCLCRSAKCQQTIA